MIEGISTLANEDYEIYQTRFGFTPLLLPQRWNFYITRLRININAE
jgi:hypothetical protein